MLVVRLVLVGGARAVARRAPATDRFGPDEAARNCQHIGRIARMDTQCSDRVPWILHVQGPRGRLHYRFLRHGQRPSVITRAGAVIVVRGPRPQLEMLQLQAGQPA